MGGVAGGGYEERLVLASTASVKREEDGAASFRVQGAVLGRLGLAEEKSRQADGKRSLDDATRRFGCPPLFAIFGGRRTKALLSLGPPVGG